MKKDMVSVIIPIYNRAGLIKRSAMSVLNQTYHNLELIIVDDGSTDNTEEIVKSIDDPRVLYLRQPNQGACAARNNGIDHAQGEFIAFQDSDDVWHTDKLTKQLATLKKTEADIVVCTNCPICNGKKHSFYIPHKQGFIPNDKPPIWIGTQTFFGKAEVFKEHKFDIAVKRWQDFEILVRIHSKYKIYYMQDELVDYYVQTDSITHKNSDDLLQTWNIILEKNPDIKNKYANNAELITKILLNETKFVSDKSIKKRLQNLALSFCTSFYAKYKGYIRMIYINNLYHPLKRIYYIFHH